MIDEELDMIDDIEDGADADHESHEDAVADVVADADADHEGHEGADVNDEGEESEEMNVVPNYSLFQEEKELYNIQDS